MHVSKTKFERKSSGVPSLGLKWENKTYKLKRSIGKSNIRTRDGMLQGHTCINNSGKKNSYWRSIFFIFFFIFFFP